MAFYIDDVYIISYARTPIGAFLGRLSEFSATELGAAAIKGLISLSFNYNVFQCSYFRQGSLIKSK